MELDASPTGLSRAIDAVAWGLRVSEQRGGPAPADHLAQLRLHLLRARRQSWRTGRRAEVDLAVALVRAQLDGTDAAVPLGDRRLLARLVTDLSRFERALRLTIPEGVAA